MELEIVPPPTDDERGAIAAALERALPPPEAHAGRGRWWRAGILEYVEEPEPGPVGASELSSGYATARRRNRLGATRA